MRPTSTHPVPASLSDVSQSELCLGYVAIVAFIYLYVSGRVYLHRHTLILKNSATVRTLKIDDTNHLVKGNQIFNMLKVLGPDYCGDSIGESRSPICITNMKGHCDIQSIFNAYPVSPDSRIPSFLDVTPGTWLTRGGWWWHLVDQGWLTFGQK
jgi:hypothetical protein